MNEIVIKVHPMDIELLKYVYAIGCNDLEIEFETFLKCRDSVFVIVNKDTSDLHNPIIDGIVACCRTTAEECDISTLDFYPIPYNVIYEIKICNIIQNSNSNFSDILSSILNTVSVDKNDAFIILRYYQSEINDEIKCAFLKCGYKLYNQDNKCITFVKQPTLIGFNT